MMPMKWAIPWAAAIVTGGWIVGSERYDTSSRWRWVAVLCYVLAGVIAFFSGCAHVNAPVDSPPIVLSERAGSVAAKAIGRLAGQDPKATTLPGLRPIVFQPADAKDECLIAHEIVHEDDQREMGGVEWVVTYVGQVLACERGNEREWCLRNIPLEALAYSVQHTCQRVRAEGGAP